MFLSKSKIILTHVIGWLLFSALIIGFTTLSPGGTYEVSQALTLSYFLFFAAYVFLFYFNANFLFPTFYLHKNYFTYFGIILLILVMFFFLQPYDTLVSNHGHYFHPPGPPQESHALNDSPPRPENFEHPSPRKGPLIDLISIILFIMIIAISSVIEIIKQWQNTQQRVVKAEADKANAELSFLKAQINPHFLFNTLNNIYSMAVTNSTKTAESIMKLSNIMRYVTDDINNNYVSLSEEVACMQDYIDLQKMRLNEDAVVNFLVEGYIENKEIAPLILITFIENVFKYGISNHEPSTITIKLTADKKSIIFFCQNKIFNGIRKVERTGIGIANTKQRLSHLYPGKYLLNISEDNELYTVSLKLEV